MAKALAHPLRVQLLSLLNEGVASPNELAKKLDEPLTNVSYHVRMLHDLGCIELVETEPRRGALEHYYRAIVRPFFADKDWKKLPKNARGSISDAVLQLVWDDSAEAIKTGLFDEREDRHLSRSVLCVDEQGWEELNELLVETLDQAMQIQADSAGRAAKADTDRFGVNLVMMSHPAPSSAKQSTAPRSGTRKRSSKKKAAAKA
ncbi:MAG TPA: helix-turn-helix domain-containing protein [Thermoleophilaceae bacterium]|nr:helix-turn-helix domain-containing protein [Thermoleophilaceae bacterium]